MVNRQLRRTVFVSLVVSMVVTSPRPAGAATFTFETVPYNTVVPFSLTEDGLTAAFTSLEPPNPFFPKTFFIGEAGFLFRFLSGKYLVDGDPSTVGFVNISFSEPVSFFSAAFALSGLGNPPWQLSAFACRERCALATIATGTIQPGFFNPEGIISFSDPLGFDGVLLVANLANFGIDTVTVVPQSAVPEPASLLLMGVGLLKFRSLSPALSRAALSVRTAARRAWHRPELLTVDPQQCQSLNRFAFDR